MRNFIVEDRVAGEVVLEGKISAVGGVIVSTSSDTLNEGQIKGIVSQISRDLAAGNNRGRLGTDTLAWVEVEG